MIIFIKGINPEPWTSPKLGTKRAGSKVLPMAYKDEGLRSYQEAIAETVLDLLTANDIYTPLYVEETLRVQFHFWRQTESYQGMNRRNTRSRPDVTNMVKAIEDALQGIVYKNDQNNICVAGNLMAIGPNVDPAIVIEIDEAVANPKATADIIQEMLEDANELVLHDGSSCWIVP